MAFLLRLCGLLRGRSGKAIAPAAAIVFAVCAASAHAATCVQWSGDNGKTWQSSTAAACAAMKGSPGYGSATTSVTEKSEGVCKIMDSGMYIRDEQLARRDGDCGDQCSARAGSSEIINVTAAWQRTPSTAPNQDWLYPSKWKFGSSNSICGSDKCEQSFDPLEPCADCTSYVSQTPAANGMYRVSVEMQGHYSGKACTPSDMDKLVTPSDTVDPPCPGFVGEVNGVRGCYGNAEKPVRPEASSGPAGSSDKEQGNPAAGPKPSSGPGSGVGGESRTPSVGTGGSAGGPGSAAGNGKKPDGTTTKPTEGKEQQACGAPGQPKCRIDETGVPDGKGAYDKADKGLDEIDAKRKEMSDGVKSTSDKDTSWGIVPSWLQHSGCTPWDLGTLPIGPGVPIQVDVCRVMPYVEAIMSFMWAAVTFLATLHMVFRVTTAAKD